MYFILISIIFVIVVVSLGVKIFHDESIRRSTLNINNKDIERRFSPDNTIIIFDIHGVLFKPDYVRIIKTLWKSPYKYRCIWYAIHPSTWVDYARLKQDRVIFERYLEHFLNKYPSLQPCLSLVVTIVNMQKPISTTVRLVEKLHGVGYTLHIMSNIGEPIGKNLWGKFPEVFRYFTVLKTPTAKNNYMKKAHAAFFHEYVREHNRMGKHILFIDDDVENIHFAQTFGIHGIFFSRPAQLKKDLVRVGVTVPD